VSAAYSSYIIENLSPTDIYGITLSGVTSAGAGPVSNLKIEDGDVVTNNPFVDDTGSIVGIVIVVIVLALAAIVGILILVLVVRKLRRRKQIFSPRGPISDDEYGIHYDELSQLLLFVVEKC
jgi:hypothetical protein